MARGKKPNVAQRNALKKVVKDDWPNYLFISTEVKDLDSETDHLTKDGVKETWYIFKHRETGEIVKARAKR